MSEFFDANLAVIASRWPVLAEMLAGCEAEPLESVQLVEGLDSTLSVRGVQLTSRHGRHREAAFLAGQLPEQAPVAHVYGTGLGDLQAAVLERAGLKTLVVHILNEHIFKLVLQLLDQRHWLSDPRVVLQMASTNQEIQLPFVPYAAELVLVSDRNIKMRDRLAAELDIPYNQQRFAEEEPRRRKRLRENQAYFATDPDVRRLFAKPGVDKAWVLAPGPSLASHFDTLKAYAARPDRPLFIALDTAAKSLVAAGVVPDLVVTMDIDVTVRHLPCEQSQNIGLVYFPITHFELLDAWQGPRYLAMSASPFFEPLRKELDRGMLYTAGSIVHPAIDLAVQMGAKEITLLGTDFAFIDDKTHTGWEAGQLSHDIQQTDEWTLSGEGRRVRTLRNLRAYLCGVERYIAAHPQVLFYNSSKAGAVIEGTRYHPELVKA